MTDNLPARRDDQGFDGSPDLLPARREPAPVARAMTDVDSWTSVIRDVVTLSEHVADTAFVPKGLKGQAPAVAAAILFGREIGLGPMASLQNVHVIEGTPTLRAEHLRAMVLAAGHELWYPELGGGRVIAAGKRRGSSREYRVEWSIDMAREAGLLGKSNWKSYPRQMLAARATAELCKLIFPDITHGLYATEEIEDTGAPDAGAESSGARPAASGGTGSGGTREVTRKRAASKGGGGGEQTAGAGASASGPSEPPPPPPVPASPATAEPAAEVPSPPAPPVSAGDGSPADITATGSDEEYERMLEEQAATERGDLPPGVYPETRERMADPQQVRELNIRLTGLEVKDRGAKLYVLTSLLGREIGSSKDLTSEEADDLIDAFKGCESREELTAMVDEAVRDRATHPDAEPDGDPTE